MKAVRAQFDHGVLRPDGPVSLREGERVQLVILRESEPGRWDLDRLAAGAAEDRDLAETGIPAWADDLDALDRH